MKRSKTVDDAIRDTYAVLASHAAKGAVASIQAGSFANADAKMAFVERWLDKAGARATSWRYSRP